MLTLLCFYMNILTKNRLKTVKNNVFSTEADLSGFLKSRLITYGRTHKNKYCIHQK